MNLKIFPILGGTRPTCITHLTSVKSGSEMMVWSHVNALYPIGGVNSTTFYPELRNEFKNFALWGGPFHNFLS